jgi:hypothetical protein
MAASVSGARVKGLAFRTAMNVFASQVPPGDVQRALERMPVQVGERLRASGTVASTWYPIEDYAGMWDGFMHVAMGKRDFPRVIGRLCVEHDLKLVHKLVLRAMSVSTVAKLATRVFSGYYDTGESAAELVEARQFHVSFRGCKGFTTPMWSEIRGAVEMFGESASGCPATSRWIALPADDSGVLEVSW